MVPSLESSEGTYLLVGPAASRAQPTNQVPVNTK